MATLPITAEQNKFKQLDKVINTAEGTNKLINKYVVSPLNNLGIAGFVFDIEGDQKVELAAEATDHFAEDNTAIQDHIALRPVIITLRGYVGELINEAADPKDELQKVAEKLTIVNSYLPVLTSGMKQLKNNLKKKKETKADYVNASLGSAVDLYSTYQKLNPPKTRQAKAFNFFRAMFEARQLVSVDTPYGFFDEMAIIAISAIQAENSKYISDFSITLKQFRLAETQTVDFNINDYDKFQGRAKGQNSSVEDKGKVQGEKKPVTSLLLKLNDFIKN